MKKTIALLLALVLTVGLTACGSGGKGDTASTTTTVAAPSASATTTTATIATSVVAGTDADGSTVTSVVEITATTTTTTAVTGGESSTTTITTTTVYVPSGATVPIGTKPTGTTTTATKAPTTTAPAEDPTGSGSTTATTTTTAPTTTTTKPTEPEGPYIVLPEIGTDIDVTKKKNRIRVSGVSAWFNDDGTIGVSLTFKNYTTNWITEETDWVAYTCYDKNGNEVQAATKITLGCIDTKKNAEKTFAFDVPANTAEVRITGSKIVYWTEWS